MLNSTGQKHSNKKYKKLNNYNYSINNSNHKLYNFQVKYLPKHKIYKKDHLVES